MNLEKFVQGPYRALVMVSVTITLVFCDIALISHIINNPPDKKEMLTINYAWLIPATISAYIWCAATVVSFVMIFAKRPLKSYKEEGIIRGLIISLTMGIIVSFIAVTLFGFTTGLTTGLTTCLILSLIIGLIIGFSDEFKKPKEEPVIQSQPAS